MQHIVFGAGLIGGYLYGALQAQGQSVAMVARPSVRDKLAKGLTISDYLGNQEYIAAPQFIDSDCATPCRYLWITLKCSAVAAALDELAVFVNAETQIFCCQNGLGCEQLVKQRFPNNRVLRVVAMFNITELAAGHLHRGSQGKLYIEYSIESIEDLAGKISSPMLQVEVHADMQALLWAKLQVNLANAVNALADMPMRAMMEQRDFRRCMAKLMQELLAVTAAKGIRLTKLTLLPPQLLPSLLRAPDCLFRLLLDKIITVDPSVRTSMWWDIHEGRLTEVDYLNGAVVKAAEHLGIRCPANKRIVEMVHQLERGELQAGITAKELWLALRRA